jgi:hypothetical protein
VLICLQEKLVSTVAFKQEKKRNTNLRPQVDTSELDFVLREISADFSSIRGWLQWMQLTVHCQLVEQRNRGQDLLGGVDHMSLNILGPIFLE